MRIQNGTPIQATATHATSAVASVAASGSLAYYLTDISGSSDKAGAKILVKDGTTVIWQDIVGAGNYTMNFLNPLKATSGNLVSVTVDGTALCNANLSGFSL